MHGVKLPVRVIVGQYNPIRYRGYYYDTDTGFYYLQSRYYDPEIKRFINADAYVNANGDFIGFNMYAYCSNNPVNLVDNDGKSATAAFQAWLSGGWAVAVAEPTVFGEIIYGAGLVLFGIAAAVETVVLAEAVVDKTVQTIEKRKSNLEDRSYTVYFLEDSNHEIQYVGRVTDDGYNARMNYHRRTKGLEPAYYIQGLTRAQARGLEEMGMIQCHTIKKGSKINNKIHGISPNNVNRDCYMIEGEKYLLNRISNTLLNIFNP